MSDVIVGIDGTDAALAAIAWGAREAAALGTGLRLVHVLGWPYDTPEADDDPAHQEAAAISAEMLAEAAAHVRSLAPGVPTTTTTRWGAAGPTVLAEAQEAVAIVLGHRHRTGFAGTLLGSLGVGIAARAACPVILVPATARDSQREGQRDATSRVVVGVDGSPSSRPALDFAVGYAERHGMPVEALVAAGHHRAPEEAEALQDVRRLIEDCARSRSAQLRERAVSGRPVEALTAAAAGADLLVVGCRGRSGEARPLLGSVSRGAVYLARSPVAVV